MQRRRFSKYFPILFLLADLLMLNIGFIISNLLRFDSMWFSSNNYPLLLLFLNLSWTVVYFSSGLHNPDREATLTQQVNKILTALVVNIGIVFTFWAATKSYYYSREHLFYAYLIFSVLLVSWRVSFDYFIKYYRTKGYNIRRVAIVGYGRIAKSLEKHFNENPQLGYKVVGFFDHVNSNEEVIGSVNDFYPYARQQPVDIVFCCLPKLYHDDIKQLVDFSENNLIKIKLLSDFSALGSRHMTVQQYGSIPVINVSSIPLDSKLNRSIKRTFDVIFSSVVIVFLLSWLLPIIGLLIKLESPGPVFFRQSRHGKNNRSFLCYKFRTMVVNRDADSKQAVKNDPRVTSLGGLLRRTSVDELPQFLNVFLGDMSVVGPRPHPIKLNEKYSPRIDRFYQRHAVKPGITGLAQAKGYRGETTHFRDMYGRVKLDRFYIKNWTLSLDLRIIILTLLSIVNNNDNAY